MASLKCIENEIVTLWLTGEGFHKDSQKYDGLFRQCPVGRFRFFSYLWRDGGICL